MTTAAITVRREPPRSPRVWLASTGRLLRLELRRNTMVWLLPLLAVLMWYGPYRVSMEYAPVWDLRASVMLDHFLPLLALGAGVAAWTGSRDARRRTTDLVTATPRPGWPRLLATCAATSCWMLAAYACLVAVLYGVTSRQATWGGPAWWPVAVGAAALAATCALGFAVGRSSPAGSPRRWPPSARSSYP
jgi:peptidoglycan/LPS O-acetylase OafA/YrhL